MRDGKKKGPARNLIYCQLLIYLWLLTVVPKHSNEPLTSFINQASTCQNIGGTWEPCCLS
jgi:hypothetical protein